MSPLHIVLLGLVVPALSYAAVAGGYVALSRPWMGVAFVGYVLGNVGIFMDTWTRP